MLNSNYLRIEFRKHRKLLGIPVAEDPKQPDNPPYDTDKVFSSAMLIGSLIGALLIIMATCKPAHADIVDMEKIMRIESNGRNIASHIKSEHAIGIFQVTPVVLNEYNAFHNSTYKSHDLFNIKLNRDIASWYLNIRIPQMLRAYRKPVSVRNVLIAYNAGISYVVSGKSLPNITVRYLRKYGA